MNKLTVALLSGGISSERDVSKKGGDQVFQALNKDRYNVVRYDPKFDLARLVADATTIDVALIILHGPYGEDGTVQGLLDLLHIPYQGAGVLGSALAMNKVVSKKIYEKAGIPVPPYRVVDGREAFDCGECVRGLGLPLVVKPVCGGSSIGMSIARTAEDVTEALAKAWKCDEAVLIESYVDGIEITGSVMGNANLTALPLVEIVPGGLHEFFNYEAKYTPGATEEICPARIDDVLTEKAMAYSKLAHSALCCQDYSRTDMIVKGGDIFVLETNTIPGMTETSLLPLAAKAAGFTFSQLLDRLIEYTMARQRERKRSG
jgi:D-alanine-D-alanine ligase